MHKILKLLKNILYIFIFLFEIYIVLKSFTILHSQRLNLPKLFLTTTSITMQTLKRVLSIFSER